MDHRIDGYSAHFTVDLYMPCFWSVSYGMENFGHDADRITLTHRFYTNGFLSDSIAKRQFLT